MTADENQIRNHAKLKRAYDYIIIGSGASGAVIAGELSKTGAEVLVIESGGEDAGPTVTNPSIWFHNVGSPFDWALPIVPTPQLNNRHFNMALGRILGGDEAEIEQAIAKAKGLDGAMAVPVRLSKADGHYSIEIAAGNNGPASVIALRVARTTTVQIQRGENAGKSITYTNVVRAIDKVGEWTGNPATFSLPGVTQEGEGFVVLVQKGTLEHPGAILAASKSDGL